MRPYIKSKRFWLGAVLGYAGFALMSGGYLLATSEPVVKLGVGIAQTWEPEQVTQCSRELLPPLTLPEYAEGWKDGVPLPYFGLVPDGHIPVPFNGPGGGVFFIPPCDEFVADGQVAEPGTLLMALTGLFALWRIRHE